MLAIAGGAYLTAIAPIYTPVWGIIFRAVLGIGETINSDCMYFSF